MFNYLGEYITLGSAFNYPEEYVQLPRGSMLDYPGKYVQLSWGIFSTTLGSMFNYPGEHAEN